MQDVSHTVPAINKNNVSSLQLPVFSHETADVWFAISLFEVCHSKALNTPFETKVTKNLTEDKDLNTAGGDVI